MDENNTDIHELSGKTPEFRTQLAKQLEDLVPEAIADGKVDVAKLKELLDEDAGDTNERFGLFWPGKKRAMRAAQDSTTATLKPAKELSKDWDTTQNIFIEGDNLEVLKVLQKQYHNAIKMIYIDPPYNTGKDFVYPDNFKEGLQNYLEFSKQVDAGGKKISTNAETTGRYHSNWLNMMYPRLKLARNLLTDDGVIFISIDDAEQSNLKKVCDEIFGEQNFVGSIIWRGGRRNAAKYISTSHEYMLMYTRSLNSVDTSELNGWRERKQGLEKIYKTVKDLSKKMPGDYFNVSNNLKKWYGSLPDTDPAKDHKHYSYVDEKGIYFGADISRGGGGGPRWELRSRLTGNIVQTPARGWAYATEEQLNADADSGSIHFYENDGVPTRKTYLHEHETQLMETVFYKDRRGSSKRLRDLLDGNIFDFPKDELVIKDKIAAVSEKNDIILDFFSGSGTTAHAVMQLNAEDGGNRKHIQVQLPEPTDEKSEAYKAGYRKISDIARERINRAGEKIKTDYADKLAERDTPLDVGYRTYKLSDTNFKKWKSEATNDLGELQMRLDAMRSSSNDNASEEDLLVEVMLKLGLPLTSRTTEREVSGLTVHQVVASADLDDSDIQPVFYLNEHIKPTLEQLRAIVTELTPSRFIILDDAFQGDSQLKTNLAQTCKSYDVELWTV